MSRQTNHEIAHAARRYVAARHALLDASDHHAVLLAVADVDDWWHQLTIAVGDHRDAECCEGGT